MEDQPRQQRQAAATQELRDLSSSTRGPSTTQVLRVLMLVLLSGVLLLLAGLSLAGTLTGLAVTAPLFVLFSPVLIASALTIGLVVTGFLMSAAFVLMALFFFMRMNSLWTRMGEQCTISVGERRDSGPSASVDNGNGKSVVAVDQQQRVIGNNYYVFLSFRGPDTRKGFADHLYHKLKDVGLRFHPNFVFRDNEDLPFGEDLGANLISAIMHSKVSIPIISKNYADSEWCLRELIGIMECKESRGQIVLPVLYKVETKDVRYLKGSVKHAFESRKYWSDEAVKQRGKEALRKAAECRVYESENFADGHEAELVDELVATVMRKQQEDFQPYLHENLVGNDDDVVEVMRLVDTACPNTRIIGIYGISGIGKTTLATIVYEKLFDKFDCRSFLRDVGEKLKSNGIEHVQSQLISDILNKPKYQVLDSNEGIKMIQTNCAEKKVLILLDDVNHQDHLNKLIGNGKFMRGSRIIITCRDEATLKSEYHKYKCRELNLTNSLRLFNIHAFEGKPPPMELASLSSEIVATTGGLPLALIVIGSLLKRTKDPKAWEEYRDKWTKEPQREVIDRLKISYDALEEGTKQMFQDIACFFIGTDHRIATYLWSDLQLYPRSGLQKMMELSLIKYDDNKLRMHDQLRDLGRCMARPADKKHWDYKRLWDEEAMKVLGREEENENIEALCLDERGSRELVERERFKKMPNLKFLHVNDVDFDGDFGGSFSELRWLKWEGCRDSFEVTNLHLQKLVILDLSDNGISGNWRGWSSIKMERLKVLNLSWCLELKSTPNLSAFKNLEMLILEHCAHLEEINTSIGDVKRLISLNLSGCRSLEKLPKQLGELENLEELVIDRTWIKEIPPCIGSLKKLKRLSAMYCLLSAEVPSPVSSLLAECYKLQQIPSSIGKLGELVELDLSNTLIKELPESIGELKKLKILRIFCSQIEELPSSIGKLQSLQEFDADGCFYLKAEIHVDKGGLSSLKTLCLGRAKISCLPENLDQLSSLEHLDLLGCRDLQSLPKLPFSLSCLRLTHESNELPSLSHLKHLKELVLWLCKSLQSIPELPFCIRKLCVERCPKLERLPKLSDLEFLSELGLVECNGLKKLDGLEALKSLGELNPSRESELFNLDDFDAKVDKLHAIPGLEKLGSLEVVDISGCKHIEVLDLSKSKDLKELIVRNCESLVEIHCPSNFLEHFDRHGCKSLKKLPAFLPPDRARFNYRTFTTCPHGRKVELIKEEVRVIAYEQQHDFLSPLPENLVGIDDCVAKVIVIWGIGGIGKTTLATNIYNKLAKKFELRSSLMDIRETINRKGMEHIQSLLISDITKNHESRVRDSMMGIGKIQLSCEKKKVLILLDDVGHQDHIDKLIGGCNFESGSRIIITCNAFLKSEYKHYEVREMNCEDSMLVFSLYAFEANQPPTDFMILSSDIVVTTGGLPLTLEIIGSFLKRKDKSIWIETLQKLRKVPHKDVQKKLKISYNALEHNEKHMFLDIACFFIGIDKRVVTYLWEDLQLYPYLGLARMIELSLIKYGDNYELRMHDQLRDLGRAIARSLHKKPWHHSRLWDEEAMKVLRCKEEIENIEALRLDEMGSREFVEQESFRKMPNLKFLHVKDVDFGGDFEGLFSELRWLKWERRRDSFEVTNFHFEKLVILDLSDGDISEKWRGWSSIKMERLKVLDLSRCSRLKSTPNLSAFKNLKMLILKDCAHLKEIDPSIGDVKHLVSLNLRCCWSLKKLSEQLGKLENLEELVIDHIGMREIPPCIGSLKKLKRLSASWSWRSTEVPSSIIHPVSSLLTECYKLEQINSSIGKLGELVELDLSDTGIKELPESIGELTKLKILRICNSQIQRLPSSIGKLQSLQELDANECHNLEGQILVDEGGLSSLKTVHLGYTKISGLPENLDQLYSLEHLDLIGCGELQSLPKPPFSLSSLRLTCRSNELPSLCHLKHLKELTLHFCMSLQSIPELPSCIRTLHVWGCPKLERLPKLCDLEFLSKLGLAECNGLKKLDGVEALKSLRVLDLSKGREWSILNDFDAKEDNLHVIQGLEKLGSLEVVDISARKHIQVLDLSKSEHLKTLIVRDCKSLVEIRCPSKFLEHFARDGCESLKKLPDFLPHGELWSDLDEEAY